MRAIFLFLCFLAGCAHSTPKCIEHGGIRRESPNFIFCKNGPIYDKRNNWYIPRYDDPVPGNVFEEPGL